MGLCRDLLMRDRIEHKCVLNIVTIRSVLSPETEEGTEHAYLLSVFDI